ncbi:hypothetical protein BT69DRAFT_1298498 [Atractiella rhizophila]|nr:hypothetical protein BT69DRAFT_1298498 [Atractiella rhizophila]
MKIDVDGIFIEKGRSENNQGYPTSKIFSRVFDMEDISPLTWHDEIAKLDYVIRCDEYHVIPQALTVDIGPFGEDYILAQLQQICAFSFLCEDIMDQIQVNYPKEDALCGRNGDIVSFYDLELSDKVEQIMAAATKSELVSLFCSPQQERRSCGVYILPSSEDTSVTIRFYQHHGTLNAKNVCSGRRRETIADVVRLLANALEEAEQEAVEFMQQFGDQAAGATDICGNDSCWRAGTA